MFPQRLRSRLVLMFFHLLGRLPLRMAQKIGSFLGRLGWWLKSDYRRITEINLQLCLPDQTPEQRTWLGQQSMRETGKTLMEIPLMWEQPVEECLGLIRHFEGLEYVERARASGRGLILLAPHIGNWELAGLYFSTRFDMAALYRPPKVPEMEDYMRQVRGRAGSELVPTDRRGVMRLFSILRQNGVVGILPDQNPGASGGAFAPFFGIPARTMQLVPRLIQKTGAQVLMTYARRLKNGQGFELVVRPPDPRLFSEDAEVALEGLNASVEICVREVPAQYQWEYKRFRHQPKGHPLPYRNNQIA
ncbi:lysophospholipid acyltransferase family protein [Marinobacteraceae bacterium S3BR75-40.1]